MTSKKSSQAPRPSEVFARRMREVREAKRWSQQDLADRLAELGEPVDRTTIARTESNSRGLSLDDAIAYSAALGPSPIYLAIPLNEPDVALTAKLVVNPNEARRWIRGSHRLRAEDARITTTEVPEEEFIAREHTGLNWAVLRMQEIVDAIVADDRERAADLIDGLNPVLDGLAKSQRARQERSSGKH